MVKKYFLVFIIYILFYSTFLITSKILEQDILRIYNYFFFLIYNYIYIFVFMDSYYYYYFFLIFQ